MPKNIVVCSDGTGNTANKNRGTNVFKIFEAVDLRKENFSSPEGNGKTIDRQVTIYDDGVGSQNFILFKILGGAFGWGLKQNVKQLYTELARVYDEGDHIYFFGFSRGAFTVRTLVGFIASCGIPRKDSFKNKDELERIVDDAYKCHQQKYRSRLSHVCFPNWLINWLPKGLMNRLPRTISLRLPFGVTYSPDKYHQKPKIKFIGVWDTVSAVGMPFKELTKFWNEYIYRFSFKDNCLYQNTEKACHALSIDDERLTFHPELWNEDPDAYGKTEDDWDPEWIEQVWFPGVHSNVGGGYPKQGMSLVTLHWMMVRAHNAGLLFVDHDYDVVREHANIADKLYKSRAGLAVYYRYMPRNILALCNQWDEKKAKHTVKIDPIKVHESLKERIGLGTEGYAPGALPPEFLLVRDKPGAHDDYSYSHQVFSGANPKKETDLWKKIHPYINLRKTAHFLFLVFSIVGVVLYLCPLFQAAGKHPVGTPAPDCLEVLGKVWENFAVFDLLWSVVSNPLLAPLLLFVFGISVFARKKMASIRTEFWGPFRQVPKLRHIGANIPGWKN